MNTKRGLSVSLTSMAVTLQSRLGLTLMASTPREKTLLITEESRRPTLDFVSLTTDPLLKFRMKTN